MDKLLLKSIFIVYCTLISISGVAQKSSSYFVEYSPECFEAYTMLSDLKLDSASLLIDIAKKEDPFNLAVVHLENYLDFFELFIGEDFEAFERLSKNKHKRIKLLRKKLPDSNPYKKFLLAEIHLQWALIRSKFDQYFGASREIYTAYNLLVDNKHQFPDFIYNNKSLSLMHALIETITIPGVVKSIFGIEGSIEQGRSEIEELIEYAKHEAFIFSREVDAIYGFILFFQCNEQDASKEYILHSSLVPAESLTATFVYTKLLQRSGSNDEALEILNSRPKGSGYSEFHYLYFLEGLSHLRNMDASALEDLEFFVQNFNGRHYLKEAYQKIAWAHLIFNNDTTAYFQNMQTLLDAGHAVIDDDKQAEKEAKAEVIPEVNILKARLLFDGGYYDRAASILNEASYLSKGPYSLEYYYRLARIYQASQSYAKAEHYFLQVIEEGKLSNEYFACASALQLGLIYENLNDINTAIDYYKLCLKLSPDSYKRSLHQKAKSGIQRHKKK